MKSDSERAFVGILVVKYTQFCCFFVFNVFSLLLMNNNRREPHSGSFRAFILVSGVGLKLQTVTVMWA
jgi:hypothetical protein